MRTRNRFSHFEIIVRVPTTFARVHQVSRPFENQSRQLKIRR